MEKDIYGQGFDIFGDDEPLRSESQMDHTLNEGEDEDEDEDEDDDDEDEDDMEDEDEENDMEEE